MDFVSAARAASLAGVLDIARQATHQVTSAARTSQATADGMPGIARVYASELLDKNTCDPCAGVDGKEYATVDAAHVDYREHGGFRNCGGGLRCRGTLVFVFDTETPSYPVDTGWQPFTHPTPTGRTFTYTNPDAVVVWEASASPAARAAFLSDVATVLASRPAAARVPVTIRVPAAVNDLLQPPGRSTPAKGSYWRREGVVTVHPTIAGERPWPYPTPDYSPAPYRATMTERQAVLLHEIGHAVDHRLGSTTDNAGRVKPAEEAFWRDQFRDVDGFGYAKTKVREAYAEMYAQWASGQHHPVADAYARRYGWK